VLTPGKQCQKMNNPWLHSIWPLTQGLTPRIDVLTPCNNVASKNERIILIQKTRFTTSFKVCISFYIMTKRDESTYSPTYRTKTETDFNGRAI
jgi:hypothetical protein